MPNKLVLCLDGTSNQYCADNTNVIKFLALLDKRARDQMVYYQTGVGTMVPPGLSGRVKRWFVERLDLAFATLLDDHVEAAYRFLMRYYKEGDEVFVFGFSRGAYTARVLAGMLCKVGLLAQGNEELVPFAWATYARQKNVDEASGFKETFGRDVPIAFLGVWDTVSSVRYAWRDRSFDYTYDNPIVKKVRHAVSLDERRAYFRQNMWKEPPRPGQDVIQVWFPGVHCDVGGGYTESQSGLSKDALAWMVGEVGGSLTFSSAIFESRVPAVDRDGYTAPSALAQMHRSLRGLWWIVEVIPKRVRDPSRNYASRWIVPLGQPRHITQIPGRTTKVHTSVIERMRGADVDYLPSNLPDRYEVTPTLLPVFRA